MTGRNAPRSRTGCSTCRSRKVKCDETRPSCRRCECSQVRCEWLNVARRPRAKTTTTQAGGCASPRQTRYATLLPRGPLSPITTFSLSEQDREYLAFFLHSSLVQWLGKPWKWASLNYLHSKIAPHSPVVLKMVLAIAATELVGIRCAQQRDFQEQDRAGEPGAAHYRSALRDFRYLLEKPQPFSQSQINEILAAFLLMVVYEHHFSSETVGLVVHLRGIYTFLRSCGVTFQHLSPQRVQLPELSQQLLLFVMYIHLSTIHQDRITPNLWEEAGYDSHFSLVLDQLFQASRNAPLAIWQSEYPTEELVDDVSVFRPLELFNECNKIKSQLLLEKQQSIPAEDAGELARGLASLGDRFRDLIAVSQRSASGLRRRELQTIHFAVAEYYATELLLHQRSCATEDLSCHWRSLNAALNILKRISRDDDSKLGRVLWVMAVVGELASEAADRRWIEEALTPTRRMGLFKCVDRWKSSISQ